jgi:hypothetical protein
MPGGVYLLGAGLALVVVDCAVSDAPLSGAGVTAANAPGKWKGGEREGP